MNKLLISSAAIVALLAGSATAFAKPATYNLQTGQTSFACINSIKVKGNTVTIPVKLQYDDSNKTMISPDGHLVHLHPCTSGPVGTTECITQQDPKDPSLVAKEFLAIPDATTIRVLEIDMSENPHLHGEDKCTINADYKKQ